MTILEIFLKIKLNNKKRERKLVTRTKFSFTFSFPLAINSKRFERWFFSSHLCLFFLYVYMHVDTGGGQESVRTPGAGVCGGELWTLHVGVGNPVQELRSPERTACAPNLALTRVSFVLFLLRMSPATLFAVQISLPSQAPNRSMRPPFYKDLACSYSSCAWERRSTSMLTNHVCSLLLPSLYLTCFKTVNTALRRWACTGTGDRWWTHKTDMITITTQKINYYLSRQGKSSHVLPA